MSAQDVRADLRRWTAKAPLETSLAIMIRPPLARGRAGPPPCELNGSTEGCAGFLTVMSARPSGPPMTHALKGSNWRGARAD